MFNHFDRIREIFKQRGLLFRLVIKELKVRYKYPFLGFLWAFIVPLSAILTFFFIFSYVIKVPHPGYPFFIFLASAVFPWNYFGFSVTTSTMSLLDSGNLIKKVYFPRELIPISIVILQLVLFVFSLLLMIIFLLLFGLKLRPLILALPLVILLQTIFLCGVSLIVSALQARYRDVKYIVEITLPVWFYLTPVFYPLELIGNLSPLFLKIYMLNPLTQLITFYRIVLIDGYGRSLPVQISIPGIILTNIVICLAVFWLGLAIFKRQESRFTDMI